MAAQLLPPCICRPYFDCADAEGRAVCISTVLELFQRLALRRFALAVLLILSSRSLLGNLAEKALIVKPVITLVGRPNVGKSTLFNRLTRSRDALVADFAGTTRDRHYGEGRAGSRPYWIVDTGGFEPAARRGIIRQMAQQTRQAVDESDCILFIVDARQ